MNYTALYTVYIDRALLAIKVSYDNDSVWQDCLGIDDGDLERTMWAIEIAETVSESNLAQLPLSGFCYDVLEQTLCDYIYCAMRNRKKLSKEKVVDFIQNEINNNQNYLTNDVA